MYDDAADQQEPQRLQSRRRGDEENAAIGALVHYLQGEADRRVGARSSIEQRWIKDLQQYHGEYDDDVKAKMAKNDQSSELFVNLTGPKTDAMAARLMDLIFPTDDRSWGIQPTPVPEMGKAEGAAKTLRDDSEAKMAQVDDRLQMEGLSPQEEKTLRAMGQDAEQSRSEAMSALDELSKLKAKATDAAELMQFEIDDQLKASRYQAKCRDVIEDACKLGTGIMKGPVLTEKTQKRWIKTDQGHQLTEVMDLRPGFEWVDPWGFFPDPNGRTVADCEDFYERHLLNKKQMRKLAARPDMDAEAIDTILGTKPMDGSPAGMSELFSITGDDTHQMSGKYQVWEFTGPIDKEHFTLLIDLYNDLDALEVAEEVDNLTELQVKVWFCQGEVLKFALHPMESNEAIYSVFNVKKSESSVFGFGVPYLGRHPQSSLNAAWRMMMDNAGMAAGPQIVVNRSRIRPEHNGHDYQLKPFRIWQSVDGVTNSPAFETYNFDMNQPLLQNIIEMSRRDLDEMTSMPQIAQGEQGAGVTKTAQGMALLMNSANVNFRRVVKNWDDDMAVPNIRRMYDFNMQNSEKEEIKGDYDVDARGSSVLLVREMQSTNLMNYATMFADHPRWGAWIKEDGLMREIAKVSMIPADSILKTRDEVEQDQQKMQGQPDPMAAIEQSKMEMEQQRIELEREKIEAGLAEAELLSYGRIKAAELQYNAQMQTVAEKLNDNDEDRDLKRELAQIADKGRRDVTEATTRQKDRQLATEAHFKETKGSGL